MDFLARPYSDNCARITEGAQHALVGLSPFNSHYKPHLVEALVEWAVRNFKHVDVFTAGFEAAHTLVAAGFEPSEAVRRVNRAVRQLYAPARRALVRSGLAEPERHLHTWTGLTNRYAYATLRERVRIAYRTDPAVRKACRAVTRDAVGAVAKGPVGERQVDIGVGYAIAEMPLLIDSPSIFNVSSSVFVYHRPLELAQVLLDRPTTGLCLCPEQGFIVAEVHQEVQ
ncbi:tRNA-dependent cyclodipeptide synthase [Streptomyces sp. NPDC059003]|uniref:tRNA-dependent cyclodipeptide synthase n=1 Tax=Streptomyces sp. NPDC059003 TaxID=3346691 RepID=UPI0036AE59F6